MNLGIYRYIGALNASCYTARVQRSDLTAGRRKFLEIRGLFDFILFNSMACVALNQLLNQNDINSQNSNI